MKVRNNISQRTAALARKAAATLLLAATLGMTACQEEIPIQRPGDDDDDAQQPATVSINVGTKPAIEGITLYGVVTSTTSAATRTDAGGKWEVGDQITVSIQYFSDEKGEDAIGTATQTLTYVAPAGSGEGTPDAPGWQAVPALLPLPAGVHSLRIGYHFASFDPAQTADPTNLASMARSAYSYDTRSGANPQRVITVGRERMVGHLASTGKLNIGITGPTWGNSTTRSSSSGDGGILQGIASITGPDDGNKTQDDCTSLVVLSDPTAAIHLPAPVWYRQTAMVQLSSVQPGQQVALQVEREYLESDIKGYICYSISKTLIATNTSGEVATANIHFTPLPPAYDENGVATTKNSSFSLYDPTLGFDQLRYAHIDSKPSHIYSFFAFALYKGSGGDDAQVVDGTNEAACAALLTADNPQWVVSGGGDGDTPGDADNDKTVLANVRTALDKMKGADGEVPEAYKGTIDLVLTGVKSLLIVSDEVGAFQGRPQLRSVSLPAATEIGEKAFEGCSSLTTISLPAATEIGRRAFEGCSSLTSVSLPAATSIGMSAFIICDNLETIDLPAATSIGINAFASCPALTTLRLTAAGNIDVGEYGGTNTYAFSHFGDENILGTGGTKGTTACTLYLNHDKWWGTSSTGATPEIDTSGGDDQSWAGRYWKEIELVGDN